MPPTSPAPDEERPTFAIPWPHAVHRASDSMPCGCGRRAVHPGEVYVTIGSYGRINCWGCLVFYGWATLDDVPEPIRPEVLATQQRGQKK